MLGLALSLHNDVHVSSDTDDLEVVTRGESDPSVPLDSANYVVRGAHAVFSQCGRKPPPLHFEIEADVPVSRGLGSSAGALISGAVAANALLGNELDVMELIFTLVDIEGHAEQLAACLCGGLVAVSPPDRNAMPGTPGSRSPVAYSLPVADDLQIALAIPDLRLETKRARELLPKDVPFGDAVSNIAATAALCQGLAAGDGFLVGLGMRDRLHQDARSELNPASPDVMAAARDAGAWGACWSGAGPTILAVCEDADTAADVTSAMVDAFESHKVSAQARTCPVDFEGCVAYEIDGREVLDESLSDREDFDGE